MSYIIGHSDDDTDVAIQNSLKIIDQKNKGPIDAFIVIYKEGLSKKLSWEAQVEKALKHESKEFRQQVFS